MTLEAIVVDAEAPEVLAGFWARALGWDLVTTGSDEVELVPTDDVTTFRLRFRAGALEKTGKNPMHFDLTTTSADDQRRTIEDLLAAGARPADVGQRGDETHVVLADPEGNELCVIGAGNRFLASCPRLGAVNCDGTRALGRFFSAVLDWPLVWDQDEETAIHAPGGSGPKVTWSGPPLLPKSTRERFHLHLAPAGETPIDEALDHLLAHGASRAGGTSCDGAVPLADIDGNAVCLVWSSARHRS